MNNFTTNKQLFPQARLSIFISGTPVLQGKYYVLNEKPVFLVNIDDNKLFRNYNGYAIAAQIVETLRLFRGNKRHTKQEYRDRARIYRDY